MFKKIYLFSLITLILFLVSCAPKPSEPAVALSVEPTKPAIVPDVATTEKAPPTGETSIDAVAEDITDIGTIDKELNADELEDVENIISDIENI